MPVPAPAVDIATNVFLTVLDEPNSFKVLPMSPPLLANETLACAANALNPAFSAAPAAVKVVVVPTVVATLASSATRFTWII